MTDETQKHDGDPTAGDLNEVLRLQAVALARMSERMNTHQAGAAKPLPPPHDHRAGSHLPVLASDVALSEDSMPVLNAFREFLDQERRRTRARILWISLVFAVLFSACVAVLVWLGRERILELRADIGTANRKVEASRESAKAEIRQISENASRSVTALKRDLNSSMTQAQSVMVSNLNAKLQSRDVEMELLKEKLSSMEIENAMLIGRLREAAELEAVRQAEAETAEEADAMPVDEQAPEGISQSESVEAPTDTQRPGGADSAPIVIQRPSYNRPVRLKVPLMEP